MFEPSLCLNENPDAWFFANRDKCPRFCQLYRKYNGAVVSSIPCERAFSTSGRTITDSRSSLDSNTAQSQVFIHENLDLFPMEYRSKTQTNQKSTQNLTSKGQ